MSTTAVRSDEATEMGSVRTGSTRLEVVVIPVSDGDRTKRFYAGWAGGSTSTPARTFA